MFCPLPSTRHVSDLKATRHQAGQLKVEENPKKVFNPIRDKYYR
jgi:hypothetical protein